MAKGKGRGWGRGGEGEEIGVVCGGAVFLLFIILLPMSFAGCEYYEVCLKKRRSTSKVDTSQIYEPGNHFLGPDYFFLPFPKSAQHFTLDDLSIWSLSNAETGDAGVALHIDVSFQYQLRPESVPELFRDVGVAYEGPIRNYAIEALKTNATLWSADAYLQNRTDVEAALHNAVEVAINRGHADMVDFQLRAVDFPATGSNSFVQNKLKAAIQRENNEQEEFHQEAVLTRSMYQTEKEVKENSARQVREEAAARAVLIGAQATNQAAKTVELARNQGLNLMYTELGLTTPAQKASLDYLLTLSSSNEGKNIFIDFDQANSFS